jgi:phage terminase large subunit-like protein
MMAANRVGKTEGVGAYEVTCHLTGIYPDWWTGKRFRKPVKIWAAGDTSKTVRGIVQAKLLGEPGQLGTGMIPGDLISKITHKSGVADAIDTAWVRHASGKNSLLVLKSYDQRRESFQGTEQDVIWLDEEPPLDIYTECLMRTMTTGGLVMLTFTPLSGLSEVVLSFLPEGDLTKPAKFTVFCTWDEVPHLSQEAKDGLWRSIPPFQRDARSKGVPSLGAGAIYPVPEADITVSDFSITPRET